MDDDQRSSRVDVDDRSRHLRKHTASVFTAKVVRMGSRTPEAPSRRWISPERFPPRSKIFPATTSSAHYNGSTGFFYNGTTWTSLTCPFATGFTEPLGVSGNNVVGVYYNAAGFHGFFYDGSSWTTLDDPLSAGETYATAVDGDTVVGYYTDASGINRGYIVTVPEPSTFISAHF